LKYKTITLSSKQRTFKLLRIKIPPIHQNSRFQLCFIFSPDFKKGHTFSDAKPQTFSLLPKRNLSPLFFPHLNSTSLATIVSSNIGTFAEEEEIKSTF
jgi:hypothetical protein